LPDGLSPQAHLEAALRIENPLNIEGCTTAAVDYALKFADKDLETTIRRRITAVELVTDLVIATAEENDYIVGRCEPSVRAVLHAGSCKNVAAMRELAFLCGTADVASPAYLLTGLPMLGWTPAADGLMARACPPQTSINEWAADSATRNQSLLRMAGPSGDDLLDSTAFNKSVTEAERGVIRGPYMDIEDVPLQGISILPRNGIWEQHGDAEEPSCRCIDNMLAGEQNATAGTVSAHQPTDPDTLLAQTRAVCERYPQAPLLGWPSDFAKAYKQVPATPDQARHCVIAQWSPVHSRTVCWVTFCQLFGGKSPPLNFSRFPAWLCWVAAVLFALPLSHCVDDMIAIEPTALADSGRNAWLTLCQALGWEISMPKSPIPRNVFLVIGVLLDLSGTTPVISISKRRIASLLQIIHTVLTTGKLGSGEAASLAGKLGFALCACCGRFGRAKLRPILRRAYEHHKAINPQLASALQWWVNFLQTFSPRPIPSALQDRDLVVSYSDGEGADAGIGVGVWGTRLPNGPLAAYCEVPQCVRDLWRRKAGKDPPYNDIFLIEAIGPLVILCTFPKILKNCTWLHFIDNTAAQHSLVKGASSIESGDVIVGETWRKIQDLHIWAYFDRVESEANPVDGLSRKVFPGPWRQVLYVGIPDVIPQMVKNELNRDGRRLASVYP